MKPGSKFFNERALSKQQIYYLIGFLALSVLPHFFNLSKTVIFFFVAVLSIRSFANYFSIKNLPRWLVFILLAIGLAIVTVQYSGSVGKDFGVSLLVAMLGLKILEIKNYRDAYVLLFLCGFMLITQFLYNQEILLTLYVFSLTAFILVLLLWLNRINTKPELLAFLKTVFSLSIQAIPVMIILFVFFPRLDGPLWGFDTQSSKAITGISGSISPGSISQLSRSSATAFRVKFDNEKAIPEPELRYWRGPVIVNTDGINWQADEGPEPAEIKYRAVGKPVTYQITAEASRDNWIFALDLPATIPTGTYITKEYAVRSENKINQRSTYSLTSYPGYIANIASTQDLQDALALPENITERMYSLVKNFQNSTHSTTEYIARVLDHFNQQNFIYTLRPPRLGNNPTDEFLFETQKGFCEHYATSFVLLMRMAGIPARVVAGYQGGEWNPTGKHLIVKQSDAHAWTEVWIDNFGWQRFDPTAAVSPERIEYAINPDNTKDGAPVVFQIQADSIMGSIFKQAVWFADSLDLNWHRWVVGFSQDRQNYFLSSTGLEFLKGYKNLGITSVVLSFLFIFVLIFFLNNKPIETRDSAKIYWDKFCHKLARKGLVYQQTEGPLTIMQHAKKLLPDQAVSIQLIADLYINLRYTKHANKEKLKQFKKLVSAFH